METITWTSTGNVGSDVTILLRRNNASKIIAGSTPNDGSFDWTVFGNIPADTNYFVEIFSVSNPAIIDESDGLFTVQ